MSGLEVSEFSNDISIKLDVFGCRVLAIKSEDGWQLFYSSADGKRRPADDLIVPPFVAESEVVSYLEDLCHEWASGRHPEVQFLNGDTNGN
ncbi:MAG: hypothetical protein WBM69_05645 [Desulfobacterales bacterium]